MIIHSVSVLNKLSDLERNRNPISKKLSGLTWSPACSKMESMNRPSTKTWYERVTKTSSMNEISKRSGVALGTLHRQTQGNAALSAENVMKIARVFGPSIPDALIETGYVTREELSSVVTVGALEDATDQQLLDEIARRLDAVAEGEGGVLDESNPTVDLDDHRAKKNVSGNEEDDHHQTKVAAKKRNTIKDKGSDEGF